MINMIADLRRRSGAMGTRTPGLLHAMQALYQLSYSPSAAIETARPQRHASVQEICQLPPSPGRLAPLAVRSRTVSGGPASMAG
jgi:hypothetical protein